MVELEFSVIGARIAECIRPMLDEFETQHNIRVRLNKLNYDEAWAEVLKFALYNHGPDISQIGSTWVSNLVIMNALRPFLEREQADLGGASVFLPVLWQNGHVPGQPQLWGIPWSTATRMIFYRRQWLEKAGINEATAFGTPNQLRQTLDRLQASGVPVPWLVPTRPTTDTLHFIASWVWGTGGDFVSLDGRQLVFNQPEALEGFRNYFGLHPYVTPMAQGLEGAGAFNLFLNEPGAAVTVNGPWLWTRLSELGNSPDQIGMVLPPGVPFLGAEYLVIWKHSRHPQAAFELVRFLTSPTAQRIYHRQINMLPVRLDLLSTGLLAGNLANQVLGRELMAGRTFPSVLRWGLIEEKLVEVLAQIWQKVLARPELDLTTILQHELDPLARRLTPILNQNL